MTEDEIREILRGEFTIDIPNFEKWNPPSKGKRQWVKMDVHWHDDPKVRNLPPTCRLVYAALLGLRGRSNEPIRNLTGSSVKAYLNLDGSSAEAAIAKLVNSQLCVITKSPLDREIDREEGKTHLPPLQTDFLKDTPHTALRAWERLYGLPLLQEELPKCEAAWLASPERAERGARGLFISRWLENRAKDVGKTAAAKKAQKQLDQWLSTSTVEQ